MQNCIVPDYASCWHEIGIELNLPHGLLQTIRADHSRVQPRCIDVVKTWLQQDTNATWQKLIQVIDSPAVFNVLSHDHSESKYSVCYVIYSYCRVKSLAVKKFGK